MTLGIMCKHNGGICEWVLSTTVASVAEADTIIKTLLKDGVWHELTLTGSGTHYRFFPPHQIVLFNLY